MKFTRLRLVARALLESAERRLTFEDFQKFKEHYSDMDDAVARVAKVINEDPTDVGDVFADLYAARDAQQFSDYLDEDYLNIVPRLVAAAVFKRQQSQAASRLVESALQSVRPPRYGNKPAPKFRIGDTVKIGDRAFQIYARDYVGGEWHYYDEGGEGGPESAIQQEQRYPIGYMQGRGAA